MKYPLLCLSCKENCLNFEVSLENLDSNLEKFFAICSERRVVIVHVLKFCKNITSQKKKPDMIFHRRTFPIHLYDEPNFSKLILRPYRRSIKLGFAQSHVIPSHQPKATSLGN